MTDVQDDGSPASSDVIHEPANSNTVFELSKLLQRDQRVMRDFVQDLMRSHWRQLEVQQQRMEDLLEHRSVRLQLATQVPLPECAEHEPFASRLLPSSMSRPRSTIKSRPTTVSVTQSEVSVAETSVRPSSATAATEDWGSASWLVLTSNPAFLRKNGDKKSSTKNRRSSREARRKKVASQYDLMLQAASGTSYSTQFRKLLTDRGPCETVPRHLRGRFTLQPFLKSLAKSSAFSALVALLIFLNAVLIGVGADMELKAAFDQVEALHSQLFSHIDTAFTIVFTVELLLRIVALRREFCSHQDGS